MSGPLAPIPWFDIVLILALIVLNGVFAMSELAIVSSREARLRAMAKSGSAGARAALQLAADPSRFLSTVQIGITLIGILNGAYSGSTLGAPLSERFEYYFGLAPDTAQTVGFSIVIVITTYLSLIIGELVPKQFALRNPEAIAVIMARPMNLLSRVTAPTLVIGQEQDPLHPVDLARELAELLPSARLLALPEGGVFWTAAAEAQAALADHLAVPETLEFR